MPHPTPQRTSPILTARTRHAGLGLALLVGLGLQACDGAQSEPQPADAAVASVSKDAEGSEADKDSRDGAGAEAKADDKKNSVAAAKPTAAGDAAGAAPTGTPEPTPDSPAAIEEEPALADDDGLREPAKNSGAVGGDTREAPPSDLPPETTVEPDEPAPGMMLAHYGVGPTIATTEAPTSTFAADVDTASYAVLRAHLGRGALPDEAAVRVEEVVNYFDYHYPPPETGDFSLHAEVVPSPQRKGYHVLHLGIKGKEIAAADRAAANLVFVIDVSGSMRGERLSTVKQSLSLLVDQLRSEDTVGIVAYGGAAKVVLEPTSGSDSAKIHAAIDALRTGGSTNLEGGLALGYELIGRARVGAGINRVVLCSDGIANTGATTAEGILERVSQHAERGITISTIGVGMAGFNDVLMERLADKGDGNYAYVDTLDEAQRVFVDNLAGTLQVIAKDVKIQIAFDEKVVSRYRLLGYENRSLTKRDFADDTKDAGELGAGHTVTALYEVKITDPEADALGALRVRYKKPRGSASQLLERPLPITLVRGSYSEAAPPTQLSMVAAAYAEKLRGSYWVRNLTWQQVQGMHRQIDPALRSEPQVAELGRLIAAAAKLDKRADAFESGAPVAHMDFDRVPVLR